jgi:hypothetical protein
MMEANMLKRRDAAVAVALFFAAAIGSYSGGLQLNTDGLRHENVWFQADIGRVYANMTKRGSNHYRTKVHPLFSLATAPIVYGLNKLGVQKEVAVRMLIAGVAGLWLTSFYFVLRFLSIRVVDAIVFSLLASLSAAAVFFATVPETYLFGSLTILVVLAFVALTETRTFSYGYYVAISALSLSMTVTNWMSGIAATMANNALRRTFRITVDAFVVVTVLWAIQHAVFPTSEFFLLSPEERHYMLLKEAGGVIEKATAFFSHAVVMPEVQVLPYSGVTSCPLFSVQFSPIGSSGPLGLITTLGWGVLLILGLWAAWRDPENKKFKVVVAFIIGGQLFLHLVYGEETFLYSLHWVPLLVLVAAFGLTSTYRRWVLAIAALVSIGAAFNNFQQFKAVSSELWSEDCGAPISERDRLISAMDAHPHANWPRGLGHVLLANAGSRLEQKGYHEPGGGFSPGFGSFGVSMLFFDHDDQFKFSSSSIPLDEVTQSLSLQENAIFTRTRWYSAQWTISPVNEWTLDISTTPGLIAVVEISSSGPAGAPIHSLH